MDKEQMINFLKNIKNYSNVYTTLLLNGYKVEKEEDVEIEVIINGGDFYILESPEDEIIILTEHYFFKNKNLKTYFKKEQ